MTFNKNELAKQIWQFTIDHILWLFSTFIPDKENTQVDFAFRVVSDADG